MHDKDGVSSRTEERRLYAQYSACSRKIRHEITGTDDYQAAKARTGKHGRRILRNLEDSIASQIESNCADSLLPVQARASEACQADRERWQEAYTAYSAWG